MLFSGRISATSTMARPFSSVIIVSAKPGETIRTEL
jgi:hypothetical protein